MKFANENNLKKVINLLVTRKCWKKIRKYEKKNHYIPLGNNGDCANFALALHGLLPESQLIGVYEDHKDDDTLVHVMVRHENLLHDLFGMQDEDTFWGRKNQDFDPEQKIFLYPLTNDELKRSQISIDEHRIELFRQLLQSTPGGDN